MYFPARAPLSLAAVALLAAFAAVSCTADPSTGDADAAAEVGGDGGDGGAGDVAIDAEVDPDGADEPGPGETADADDVEQGTTEVGGACSDDRECASNVCFQIGTGGVGGFCSTFCGTDEDCPEGEWDCAFLINSGGDAARICVSPSLCLDADGDGFGFGAGCDGPDCDEEDAEVNPGAAEVCDDKDNDCDGRIDDFPVDVGEACATGFPGPCAEGRLACVNGSPVCESTRAPADEVCDGIDNDCDRSVDEDADGRPITEACYGGPEETRAVGACVEGARTCTEGRLGACVGQVLPFAELCDGIDNDCDGDIDNGDPSTGVPCSTGLPGACARGTTLCSTDTAECRQTVFPTEETCDGIDNDCDGLTDEGGDDAPIRRACYEGDEATEGVGPCRGGNQVCSAGDFGPCIGDVIPTAELCDGVDNDCDGTVDNDAVGGGSCATGLPGVCAAGVVTCDEGTAAGCRPLIPASDEVCDGLDNDCDGEIDEGTDGAPLTRECFGGREDQLGVGVCSAGTATCVGGTFSACIDQVLPGAELCNGADDDCDGDTDEDGAGAGLACDTGRSGVCGPGTTVCVDGAVECAARAEPGEERCDGIDNDCDGAIDEVGDPGSDALSRACYDGDRAQLGVGVCREGTQVCAAGEFGPCIGDVVPTAELCNALDDDCDGESDEGAVGGGSCSTGLYGICALGFTACGSDATGECIPVFEPTAETCDGVDNDCDGMIDENEDDTPLRIACYAGLEDEIGVGICRSGFSTCVAGSFAGCVGQVLPGVERCDGVDNDCNGDIDDDPVSSGTCSTGLGGVCSIGVPICLEGGVTICEPVIGPSAEVCDGIDNDCDGLVDEDELGDPLAYPCFGGTREQEDVGVCRGGLRVCVAGTLSTCQGEVLPSVETCDGLDNDCDGLDDDGNPGGGLRCDTGELGLCAPGLTACLVGEVECLPLFESEAEVCDGYDNDCDGVSDEDDAGAALTRACYDGAEGTLGVGPCVGGVQTCTRGQYATCVGQRVPVDEVCDFVDNDCDDTIDEGVQRPFYVDVDGDGYGDPSTVVLACLVEGYVTNGLDCYDLNAQANPEQTGAFTVDRGDGSYDYDCDGLETSALGGYGACESTPPLCYLQVQGWIAGEPIPECGQQGTYIFDCLGNGANCDPTTALTTQRCR